MPAPIRSLAHLRTLVVLPVLALAVVAAVLAPTTGASASTSSSRSSSTSQEKAAHQRAARQHKVIRASSVALRQIGDPYRYGGDGPRSFDCSGLMKYSYKKAGLKLPRTASAQSKRAHRIPKSKLRRGDLMFFTDGGGVYHAAMFLKWKHGHAVMVHSPGSGERVRRDHPWTKQWFGATMRG
jgi:cell wall-associated NlpC family hydrolase